MKMTKFFAMAIAVLAIVSCSKEGTGDNPGGGEEISAPTYATFHFNIGGGTRAAADFNPATSPEADAKDAKVGRMQLLIFSATTQALEANEVITTDISSKTVLLTAGRKKIFFVANSDKLTDYNTAIDPTTFKPGGATSTLADFNALNFSAGTPQTLKTLQTGSRTFDLAKLHTLSNIVTGKEAGLPMSNTNELTYTLAAGIGQREALEGVATTGEISATNTFKIQLYYMTAKARLKLAADVLSAGNDVNPVIKETFYSIRNLARATKYVQNVPTAGNPQSFYFSSTFANQVAFDKEFDYASNINVATSTTAGPYLYVPENNHSMLLRGQSSYFAIKATYEPVVITDVKYDVTLVYKHTTAKLSVADATNRNYIYTTKSVEGIPAGTYYQNVALFEKDAWIRKRQLEFIEASHREEAKLLVNDPTSVRPTLDGDYLSFTNAKSYYRIDIGSGTGAETTYGVLRSNKYDATVNKITGPGVPSEEDLIVDPTNPVSARTYIHATILPAAWTPVSQSADL